MSCNSWRGGRTEPRIHEKDVRMRLLLPVSPGKEDMPFPEPSQKAVCFEEE